MTTTVRITAPALDAVSVRAAIEGAEAEWPPRPRLTITVELARDEDHRRGWGVFVDGDLDGGPEAVSRSWEDGWRQARKVAAHCRDLGFCAVMQL
jgi:hypothetical protein